jgi:hypothetical protein
VTVIQQQYQSSLGERSIAGEDQRDVNEIVMKRLQGKRSSCVQRHDVRETQPVHVDESSETERSPTTFGWAAEAEPTREPSEVGEPTKAELGRGLLRDDETVLVLGRSRNQGPKVALTESDLKASHHLVRLAGNRLSEERECTSRVLGDHLEESSLEGRHDEFPRTERQFAVDVDALSFKRLGVELREKNALREVERSDGE